MGWLLHCHVYANIEHGPFGGDLVQSQGRSRLPTYVRSLSTCYELSVLAVGDGILYDPSMYAIIQ